MTIKRRNPVATAPILRKGGAHQKDRSAERSKTRAQLRREIAEWRPPRWCGGRQALALILPAQ
ncbi:MAG: hypothetical protein JNK31_04640 [Candidatus Competibacter sp.]|nr:hypothetical protein [Candidatus Competibacter sp.]